MAGAHAHESARRFDTKDPNPWRPRPILPRRYGSRADRSGVSYRSASRWRRFKRRGAEQAGGTEPGARSLRVSSLDGDLVDYAAQRVIAKGLRTGDTQRHHLVTRFRERLDGSPSSSPRCNASWASDVMEVDGSLRPRFLHAVTASMAHATLEEALNSRIRSPPENNSMRQRTNLPPMRPLASLPLLMNPHLASRVPGFPTVWHTVPYGSSRGRCRRTG